MCEWKSVVGWDGFYEVSNTGLVRSLKRKARTFLGERNYAGSLVSPIKNSRGYLVVNLTKPGKRVQAFVHKLVLDAFVGLRPDGFVCRHLDGCKTNNSLENILWDTQKNNVLDQYEHGTLRRGELNGKALLTEEIVKQIRKDKRSVLDIASDLGVSVGCVSKAKYRQTWVHVND